MGVRKNQSALTSDERQRFVNAVLTVKANGVYDRFVREHRDAMESGAMIAHMGAGFLPWHREYLRRLERELQRVDPSVSIPYWDWSVDQDPRRPPWTDDFMGASVDAGGRVTSGPFAFAAGRWRLNVLPRGETRPALRRRMAGGILPSRSQVTVALAQVPYDTPPYMGRSRGFRAALEHGLHDGVHNWVGGSMAGSASPNDPVFFLHHANVDRLWARWQDAHPGEPWYLPVTGGMAGVNANDPMPPWGGTATPASVTDHRRLDYSYDDDPPSGAAELVVGAPPRDAAIGQAGEVDDYRFTVPAFGTYTVETQGPTDVIMTLAGPNDAAREIAQDDDSGQDRNARISLRLGPGTYYVRVRHFQPTQRGNYRILVRAERDAPAIAELQVNGPAVSAEISAAAESDLYRFSASRLAAVYVIETQGLTDTFMTLFGPNDQTRPIAEDDDSGRESNSRLVVDLRAGVYFVRIRHWDPRGTGAYQISVRTS